MIFNTYAEQKEELAGIRLVSCGHIFAKPKREICRPGGRSDWLLFYVAKEQETFFTNRTETANAGAFILYAPGEKQHHIYEGNKTAEFYYVHFQCAALPKNIELETSRVYQLSAQNIFSSTFEEIIDETMRKAPHYETLCLSRLIFLFTLIKRELANSDDHGPGGWKSVSRAIAHMNKYCDSNLTLEDYAEMCCLSKYHFSRVFKQVTGVTPLEYRGRIRIEHAKELLDNGYLSVSEISEALGYSSPAYFSDAFKRSEGIPPSEYKKRG